MRISSGIAEINLQSYRNSRVESSKTYVWPVYNAGKVEQIRGITRRTESNIVYSKPTVEDADKLYQMATSGSMNEYTSTGTQAIKLGIEPGTLFDAIA